LRRGGLEGRRPATQGESGLNARSLNGLNVVMKNEWETKECFGRQGEGLLYGEESSECLVCELFDK
jgi:hypothetical protein